LASDVKNRIVLSKACGSLHAPDVPREKAKKILGERENETPLSKDGLESSINYSVKCMMPSESRKQCVSAV